MSTKPFTRVIWVVLDGMGFEHARLCLESKDFPALARMEREGYLGPAAPATPVCQTPPALLSLFAGADPGESGVWGYYMPRPGKRELSMSGFHSPLTGVRTIWQEMERKGWPYALMNVAFRNDPVWRDASSCLDFAYDGYRMWRKPVFHRLDRGSSRISHRGITLHAARSREGVEIRKGSRLCGSLSVGEAKLVRITSGERVLAHLLDSSLLVLNPVNLPVIRGSATVRVPHDGFFDANVFRLARRENQRRGAGIPMEAELGASSLSMRLKTDLMLAAIDQVASRLVVGYFPIVDDFNHVYVDALSAPSTAAHNPPSTAAHSARLFAACAGLVDGLLRDVMARADDDTLVVVSSDHGAASFHGVLHLNELFVREGLVRRRGDGYDLGRSAAFYHPSDCGQVIAQDRVDRGAALQAVRRALERARLEHGVDIGMQEGSARDPFLAFLYPQGDLYFTGDPPRRGRPTLESKRSGGHHLSPLSPTPWIKAMLGFWSPRSRSLARDLPSIPAANRGVKDFLLELMGA